MRRLRAAIGLRELLALTGLVLMAWGLALVYVPAALIVPGALIFGLAVWPLLRSRRDG